MRRWPATAAHIEIVLQADGGVKVVDDGRGIPVDMHPTEHKPTVEVVMTILHAGGKFGGGGYAVSGGLHGVGISVVNALSRRVDTEVRRQGHVWRMSFADGGKPQGGLVKGEETDRDGNHPDVLPGRRPSSRAPTSTSKPSVPGSSRWPSSTRACASR